MKTSQGRIAFGVGLLLVPMMLIGCGPDDKSAATADPVIGKELGLTVGSVADVARPEPLQVEGYGLVGGLAGTGSASCPPNIRAYLKQFILAQVPGGSVAPDNLINSKTTAVVRLEGVVPAAASRGDRLDVKVTPVAGSDTTSLHGGWLYKADLKLAGSFGPAARTLAVVEGPVFINTIAVAEPDPTTGYVLGGGIAQYDYVGNLRLRRADFARASAIRNRLNERYGIDTARAVSPRDVEFVIPPDYRRRKMRFVSMLAATFLDETPELKAARIETLARGLAESQAGESCEIALEAIGRESLASLQPLWNAPEEEVRLRAARCALNLRDDGAIEALRTIALDETSPLRSEALEAVMVSARRNDAISLARRLLRDKDARMILAAYESLRNMEDAAVSRELVGRSFHLEHVVQTDRKAIFVSRSGQPRVVIFGAPLTCRDNIFAEAANETVTVNSRAGQDHVSLTRKNPTGLGVLGPVRTSFSVSEIVRALGAERSRADAGDVSGLGAPYTDVVAVLEQLAAKGAVSAEFWAGPLPKIAE
ncbi:MAG: flagellar basal body P-ring protein FlgI [Sedimentisphaerales bacterium]|nr:flagellar basal body P-ring protein FlgI [Sedimentisphaerales bacterium]HNY80604.1 flagellar basal body P-ring protein FlgI [Sedimentisphaerales bacterium]HOC65419.1 flagellar basal body P-ring protein FlgI [Sedimentisphaerales bacterium]HOH66396.1 flagellar basal body P-ring protein FlgI [Sedimentisphaerales bacterium]HPY50977.1 flagellar basal body P-ring protein FlgI [Sedimentisphaerales bacterium]